ncbi:MAG: thermonuclease family protein [Candidatus Levybacteria bacterium]|nr:thermonuclease family protein [Candidatus Levybacteria bacterium]
MFKNASVCSPPCISVKRIIDGDTIVVSVDGKEEKVRLIGINSPESVDPRRPVECFGKEAKRFLESLVLGKK